MHTSSRFPGELRAIHAPKVAETTVQETRINDRREYLIVKTPRLEVYSPPSIEDASPSSACVICLYFPGHARPIVVQPCFRVESEAAQSKVGR